MNIRSWNHERILEILFHFLIPIYHYFYQNLEELTIISLTPSQDYNFKDSSKGLSSRTSAMISLLNAAWPIDKTLNWVQETPPIGRNSQYIVLKILNDEVEYAYWGKW